VRLEVKVRKDDVALIRSIVKALSNPTRGANAEERRLYGFNCD
jgi:hypothetical protein